MEKLVKKYSYGNPLSIEDAFEELLKVVGKSCFYPSTLRYRDIIYGNGVVTEKLDGTNIGFLIDQEKDLIAAISRNKRILPDLYTDNDNFGIYDYVLTNREKLIEVLGTGIHYGEWVGKGIQRGYGMSGREFVLFNTNKWMERQEELKQIPNCSLVPVLYKGTMVDGLLPYLMGRLEKNGSVFAPNYMNPEGIVIYIEALAMKFKMTFKGDFPKWKQEGKSDKRPPESPPKGFLAEESYEKMIEVINNANQKSQFFEKVEGITLNKD